MSYVWTGDGLSFSEGGKIINRLAAGGLDVQFTCREKVATSE
jgi:hypothetical protein